MGKKLIWSHDPSQLNECFVLDGLGQGKGWDMGRGQGWVHGQSYGYQGNGIEITFPCGHNIAKTNAT